MLDDRLLENDGELAIYFALTLLGSTLSRELLASIPAGSAILALDLALTFALSRSFFTFFSGALLLDALLDPALLGLILPPLLLVLRDDGFDHCLEHGFVYAVLLRGVGQIEHPLDRREPRLAIDLDL